VARQHSCPLQQSTNMLLSVGFENGTLVTDCGIISDETDDFMNMQYNDNVEFFTNNKLPQSYSDQSPNGQSNNDHSQVQDHYQVVRQEDTDSCAPRVTSSKSTANVILEFANDNITLCSQSNLLLLIFWIPLLHSFCCCCLFFFNKLR
jgi:hypothetical protein